MLASPIGMCRWEGAIYRKFYEEVMSRVLSNPPSNITSARVTIRAIRPQDVEPCGRAAYAAHTAVAAAHNVPCEHPSVPIGIPPWRSSPPSPFRVDGADEREVCKRLKTPPNKRQYAQVPQGLATIAQPTRSRHRSAHDAQLVGGETA